jgi:hypothetical protein
MMKTKSSLSALAIAAVSPHTKIFTFLLLLARLLSGFGQRDKRLSAIRLANWRYGALPATILAFLSLVASTGAQTTSSPDSSNEPSAITGTVVLPDGQPAVGAQVGLVISDDYSLWLGHAELNRQGGANLLVKADRDGHFSFPPTTRAAGIVAVNQKGYGQVEAKDFKNDLKVILQPWGRVEGVLRVGKQIGANEQVHLSVFNHFGSLEYDYRVFDAVTDRDGEFVFTCVPPGGWVVSHKGMGDQFTVKSGETNRITVGGTGRPVIGKLPLPPMVTNDAGSFGWASLDTAGRHLSDRMARDGTFRLDDVPAGTWTFEAEVLTNKTGGGVRLICTVGKTIIVPEMPGGRSDEPLDLGMVEPMMVHAPKVGDLIPSFEVKTSEDKIFSLAGHKGHYVLLDFEGYIQDHSETESVRAAWASFGKSDRLAVLTLKVPPPGGYLIEGMAQEVFPWPQTDLKSMPSLLQAPFHVSFGLPYSNTYEGDTTLPAVFLLGPDGRIVAKDLHGNAIKAAVAEACAVVPR